MLLVIDIGNTSTSFGVFKSRRLIRHWHVPTSPTLKLTNSQTHKLKNCIISSVVPKLDDIYRKTIKRLFGIKPTFVNYKNAGVKIGYPHPKEIGADRLVNARAAWERYRRACIVVDFGTATTLDYIDGHGVYWGGAIAPGIAISNDALWEKTSKLPRTKIGPVKKMIPKSTKEAIQIGIFQGYVGLVEYLIKKTIKEVGGHPSIIVTGGFARLIARHANIFHKIEPNLTLIGLKIILEKIMPSS